MRRAVATGMCAVLAALVGCGSTQHDQPPAGGSPPPTRLPGKGRPLVVVGDKNFTEQFVLGELYAQALSAEGYSVQLNRDIGPTEVSTQAMLAGQLSIYPEYLSTWDSAVAGLRARFPSARGALRAGRRYARDHGLRLLTPTPFSDTPAIAVTRSYASDHRLRSLEDLRRVAAGLTLGGPPQFEQAKTELPLLEQDYGFEPNAFKPLGVGDQYEALDSGAVQAAAVNTTDGQLTTGRYRLLRDPLHAFGWGQAVPVVPTRVIVAEGPTFVRTINRVSALLNGGAIRKLNAAVDLHGQDPAVVAKQFLQQHGLLPTPG